MPHVHVICFLASYLVALALELTRLLKSSPIHRLVMLAFGTAGLVAHTLYLLNRVGETRLPPLLSSTHDWMLVLAWLAVLFYLFLTVLARKLPVGLFLLPVVLLLIFSAYFVNQSPNQLSPRAVEVTDRAIRGWTMLHVALLVFGMCGVLVGFVLSLMYLVQHRRLKHKQTLGTHIALPSLARLARWNWWAVVVSVPLLTAGMLAGVVLSFFIQKGGRTITLADPVVLVNGVVLAGMLVFLVWITRHEHHTGKQVAWLTAWAFGFLLATMIGLQVLTGRGLLETGHASMTPDESFRDEGLAKRPFPHRDALDASVAMPRFFVTGDWSSAD